ncbi:cytosolic Fe-S cluster assembly factor NUBP2 -like protein [Brachionus plicatilis]|uniref:Cytosolic Fe-S cluster assembly factor NUBP2 homolog n=1 Tax=Brachionus plicatilis TaxID=10195 RepID=A0A3M7RGH4_BRAPC|nr:cytosolic Fe-S cluster assembly factor NUBP2 -like protein [Brachionus plicatilis]
MEVDDQKSNVKKVFLVLSGKGGVGKSSVTTQLAFALYEKGFKVGVLDVDLCGPSIPKMFNLENGIINQSETGWIPVYYDNEQRLGVISIGFLLNSKSDAVIWRGPKKNSMIKKFMTDICWGDLDYLLIDTPPGTSDEHLAVMENIKTSNYCNYSAILVTTPQNLSVNDVRREITFCRKVGIPITGIIENMSGFTCPHCKDCTYLFTKQGGKILADNSNCNFLGAIPIDPNLTQCIETGQEFLATLKDSPCYTNIKEVVDKIIE